MGWRIFQLDVKSTSLNVYHEENDYVEQPMGFAIKGQEKKVLKLKKALYDLKQALRAWNSRIDKYFQENGFVHFQHEYALYALEKFKMYDYNLVNTPMKSSLKLSKFDGGEKEDPTLFKSLVFNMNQEESTNIHIDNKSTQVLAKNPMFHEQNKHIDTRYHFNRECIIKKEVEQVHVKTQDQVANIFTKFLKFEDIRRLKVRLSM
ncbi:Copia protein, partial [Mucuna pruriens]